MEDEWPIGDEETWKIALEKEKLDPDDVQGVANTVVRHVTTSLARQAFNLDDVSSITHARARARQDADLQLAAYQATALSVRDQLLQRWNETTG